MSTEVRMPQMGESLAEGTVTRWLKKVGDHVKSDEPLFEISTDKIDTDIPSPAAGVLTKILVTENETVAVNTVVAVIDSASQTKSSTEDSVATESLSIANPGILKRRAEVSVALESTKAGAGGNDAVLSSPLVRRLAREHQIDLSQLTGSGTGGRVRKQDVLAYLEQASVATMPLETAASAPDLLSESGTVAVTAANRTVPMSAMRQRIAEHMIASRRTSAHVTTVIEADMTQIARLRENSIEECARRYGVKLNYTAFFVRAAAIVLRALPIFNASVEGANIIYKRDINIGVAIALETGLIVPVVRRADELDILGIARVVQDFAVRARSKRLRVDEVQDGTFTVTNPGMFGSLFGSPIINQPQVAILAVGVIEERVVARNHAITISPMTYLSLSYDHRIIDGAVGAQFLGRLKAELEKWHEPVL